MLGISRVAAQAAASQEGLSSIKLVYGKLLNMKVHKCAHNINFVRLSKKIKT
jgi:hypothetical protein